MVLQVGKPFITMGLLQDDDIALIMVEYIIRDALNGDEEQLRYWTKGLAVRLLAQDSTQMAGRRILQQLEVSMLSKPAVLDDVIPPPLSPYWEEAFEQAKRPEGKQDYLNLGF